MVGFIVTIQVLVYPAMAKVPADAFPTYEAFHQRRVVAVLSVFAVAEVAAAGALAVVDTGTPTAVWLVGGAILTALWVSTGAFYAPLHGRLAAGFDPALHRRLVTWNWLRVAGWSVRGVLALVGVASAA